MARDPFVVKKAYSNPLPASPLDSINNSLTGVRVKSIILDDSTSEGWAALGAIEYQDVTSNSPVTSRAYPLNSNSRCFPLINEIVYIISLPGKNMSKGSIRKKIYYINNIGIWNHPHHNAFPSDLNNLTKIQKDDYIFKGQDTNTIEDDFTIRQTSGSTGIYLGKTFEERSNIHPLLPFEGDFIQEGRWGNSLRFGSTIKNIDLSDTTRRPSQSPNNWSNYGKNGDPIIILRNGQGNQTEEGWIPIVEDVNNDDSSIYLTSTQQIPINSTDIGYGSYIAPKDESFIPYAPASPNSFSGNQIILNSGRLVFNSINDHILLSSPLSINLNAQKSINIDTRNFIVSSKNIFLGGINKATEPLLKGNLTVDFLQDLMNELQILALALLNAKTEPIILYPNSKAERISLDTSVTSTADNVLTNLKILEETYLSTPSIMKSKQNFTS